MTGEPQNRVLKFLSTFAFAILPAALASVIGGLLFTQWRNAPAPRANAALVEEAPAEQMQEAVRDAHASIANYLASQHMAAEEAEIARAKAFEEARRKAARSEAVEPKPAAKRRVAETAKAPRPPAERQDNAVIGEPLVLAPAAISPPRGPIASAIATAGELKDKVVATFGGVRDFIGNVGGKLLGRETNASRNRRHS
jgi:hypothetical protein